MGILWFIFCIAIGVFASKKGRSAFGWGLLSAVISPLIAGIILALLKDLTVDRDIQKVKMEQQQTRDRVVHNEKLTEQRFSRVEDNINQLGGGNTSTPRINGQQTSLLELKNKECPSCGGSIKSAAIKCKHCGVMVNEIKQKECPYCKEYIHKDDIICKHCNSDVTYFDGEGV